MVMFLGLVQIDMQIDGIAIGFVDREHMMSVGEASRVLNLEETLDFEGVGPVWDRYRITDHPPLPHFVMNTHLSSSQYLVIKASPIFIITTNITFPPTLSIFSNKIF
eukprot:TRINITY_DN18206_c0_g1_i1.p1 TRINITY_DN18206_c0_g1~~TRINITY_DN18206_c0_g1_i1.p1  ORF type:complete len:107 (+),score=18.32 TRINITY_DN18206_c0_g1_i1:58-378(+)